MTASFVAIAIDEDDEVSRRQKMAARRSEMGSVEGLVYLHLAALYHGDFLVLDLCIG